MDNCGEDNDCTVESVTPSKKKKLKQARLPFQVLSASKSPNSCASKKRRLSSTAVEQKRSKVQKLTKENSLEDVSKCGIDIVSNQDSNESIESVNVCVVDDENHTKEEEKHEQTPKSSSLVEYFKKVSEAKDSSNTTVSKSKHKNKKGESKVHSDKDNKQSDSNNGNTQSDSNTSVACKSDEIEECEDEKNDESTAGDSPRTPKNMKNTPQMRRQKLTPKQLAKKQEIEKKREEKEKLKMEQERKRQEERENKLREKEEKQREKEEKQREKEKKKKDKEQKKQMELEQRQKEREEEKKKKEEERQEAERKKQKEVSNFASFFVSKKQETKLTEEETNNVIQNFMPFEVKSDMRVAPVCRKFLSKNEKSVLEETHESGRFDKPQLYLEQLKNRIVVPGKSDKTWPYEAKDDVLILDDENTQSSIIMDQNRVDKQRAKLIQFVENRRPPYWGTWRKKSQVITPRKPFVKDSKWFDYEIDSDDEWEEEEPGESLRGSDDEKDEENPDDNEYDVDNEFMVPHGYLSDEEVRDQEEEEDGMSPETQKIKLKLLGEEFEAERNEKTSKLKPKIIGCISQNEDNLSASVIDYLSLREAWVREIPIKLVTGSDIGDNDIKNECSTPTSHRKSTGGAKRTKFPEQMLPDFIRLIHGNTHGRGFLVKEFITYLNKKNYLEDCNISKASLIQKIKEIAKRLPCPDEGVMHLKTCWYVSKEVRNKYFNTDEELVLPNNWEYALTPKRRSEIFDTTERPDKEDKEKKHVHLITQFTKKFSQEEMKKQLAQPLQKQPKRVALISVGRGEEFPKSLTKFNESIDQGDKHSNNVTDRTKSISNDSNRNSSQEQTDSLLKSSKPTSDTTKSTKDSINHNTIVID